MGVQICEGGGGPNPLWHRLKIHSRMYSARPFFLYYNSPINLCMMLLAILHHVVHIQGNNPTYINICPSIISVEREKSSWKNTSVESHLSVNQPPEGVYDWFLELMFVLFSFLEALTCEQNMIGNWLQTMGLTALPLPGVAQRVFLLIVAINCQAERQREESKLSTRRIVFDLIPHSLGLNYKKCTAIGGESLI